MSNNGVMDPRAVTQALRDAAAVEAAQQRAEMQRMQQQALLTQQRTFACASSIMVEHLRAGRLGVNDIDGKFGDLGAEAMLTAMRIVDGLTYGEHAVVAFVRAHDGRLPGAVELRGFMLRQAAEPAQPATQQGEPPSNG